MSADFFDSNVFLYLVDSSAPAKAAIARRLVQDALHTGEGRISFQVIQETLNVITRKFQAPVTPTDARQLMNDVLVPLWHTMPSQRLYERALDLHARYQYGFYDALIIAAALSDGCARLFSEDLQHGQQIEGLTIENPFLAVGPERS
jgi:predicted nucleic acid-binding protein